MGSSSKPKKQKPSAQDIALAEKAIADTQVFEEYYLPLEQQAIADVSGPTGEKLRADQQKLLAGRTNADLAATEQEARQGSLARTLSSGNAIDSTSAIDSENKLGTNVAEATSAVNTDAATTARNNQDLERLGVIRTGRDVNRNAQSALVTSARMANSRATNKLQNKMLTDQAKTQALGQVVSAAVTAGIDQHQKAKAIDPKTGKPLYSTEELGNGGKFFRKRMQ